MGKPSFHWKISGKVHKTFFTSTWLASCRNSSATSKLHLHLAWLRQPTTEAKGRGRQMIKIIGSKDHWIFNFWSRFFFLDQDFEFIFWSIFFLRIILPLVVIYIFSLDQGSAQKIIDHWIWIKKNISSNSKWSWSRPTRFGSPLVWYDPQKKDLDHHYMIWIRVKKIRSPVVWYDPE